MLALPDVRYHAPRSLDEAIRLLSEEGAAVLAGGTDLLVQVRGGSRRPAAYVDVKRIPDLMRASFESSGARLGAAMPCAALAEEAELARRWPGLAEACRLIGSAQIQGRATLGGNLCNGSPAADTTAALIVNRARLHLAGPSGTRTLNADQFVTGPGKTVLMRGELLVAIEVPAPAPHTADAYLRLIPRTEMDIAVAGAAVSLTLDASGVCRAARVAIAAVAPTTRLVPEAGKSLVGSRVDDAALGRAAQAASAAAQPIDDRRGTIAYRRTVIGVLTRRAAAIAAERARVR
jgi:carbon-monoxide dehydrogenase medium subunit